MGQMQSSFISHSLSLPFQPITMLDLSSSFIRSHSLLLLCSISTPLTLSLLSQGHALINTSGLMSFTISWYMCTHNHTQSLTHTHTPPFWSHRLGGVCVDWGVSLLNPTHTQWFAHTLSIKQARAHTSMQPLTVANIPVRGTLCPLTGC